MKYLFLLFVFSTSYIYANTTNPTTSSVKAVTIFVDGAQVTRHSKIILTSGTTQFSFTKLSPHIDVVIVDRIPISQNKDIKVDDIDSGNADYITKKGILTWKATIKPSTGNSYKFGYSVKYPKFRKINL